MTEQYPRLKTVRFSDDTFQRIEIAAEMFGVTTSEYPRTLVRNTVAKIDLKQVLEQKEKTGHIGYGAAKGVDDEWT